MNNQDHINSDDVRGADVKFPPPLIFLGLLGVGWLLNLALPAPLPVARLGGLATLLGSVLILLALLLIGLIFWRFKRANTEIEPWKPTHTLIDTGIYAHSRNPIYLTLAAASVGVALIAANTWMLASVPVSLWLVYQLAIKKEEAYLQRKFGRQYTDYKQRVRRWL